MTVVTDTTAVTTLLKAGEERLLREILGSVIVPRNHLFAEVFLWSYGENKAR